MADKHKHGSMTTEAQEKTFAGFITLTFRVVIFIVVLLIVLALVNG